MTQLLRRTLRGILEHLYLTVVGAGVIAAALLLIGTFVLVVRNLDGLVSTWNHDAHISAYFRPQTPAEVQVAAQQAIAGRREVASVEHVTTEEATTWMKEQMPQMTPVMEDLGKDALPASLEIVLKPEYLTTEQVEAFAKSLSDAGSFSDVDYGRDWVGRLDTFLSVLRVFGGVLGGLTAVGTLFLVANTVHLAVYARRDELAIMRLVGATDGYIVGPFAMEGALQGLLGSSVAVALLWALHQSLEGRLGTLLPAALGTQELAFLPAPSLLLLVMVGTLGGTAVNTVAVVRFLRSLP